MLLLVTVWFYLAIVSAVFIKTYLFQIGILQSIVERECEERERLTEQLKLARAAGMQSKRTH